MNIKLNKQIFKQKVEPPIGFDFSWKTTGLTEVIEIIWCLEVGCLTHHIITLKRPFQYWLELEFKNSIPTS